MIRAHTVAQVRAAEGRLRARLPPGTLLQRAATALAVACAERLGRVYGSRVLLLVGRGDNGADALHAGARLARRGAAVSAVLLGEPVADALAAFRAAGGRVVAARLPADLVVDGLVGLGGRGALRPDAAALAAEVVRDEGGRPRLVLHGGVADEAAAQGISTWHLSLSHDGGVATAVVVAES